MARSPAKALVMGILNVTPDSFSDGGRYPTVDAALHHAEALIAAGADILDIGGESTRPGAPTISYEEESSRTLPVVRAIRRRFSVPLSIDTQKFEVARAALAEGASIVNDVSGGEDLRFTELAPVTAFILMHRRGTSATMQLDPQYPAGVVLTVRDFLAGRVDAFVARGVPREKIWIDPGFGFGKTLEHNLQLLKHLRAYADVGARVVVGTSRKSFLARVLGDPDLPFADREPGGLASVLWGLQEGASVLRVHDVASTVRAVRTWEAIHASA